MKRTALGLFAVLFIAAVAAPLFAGDPVKIRQGLLVQTPSAAPPCTVGLRGQIWVQQNEAGVADTMQVCMKGSDDTYAWTAPGMQEAVADARYINATGEANLSLSNQLTADRVQAAHFQNTAGDVQLSPKSGSRIKLGGAIYSTSGGAGCDLTGVCNSGHLEVTSVFRTLATRVKDVMSYAADATLTGSLGHIILCDTNGADTTLTLPAISSSAFVDGRELEFIATAHPPYVCNVTTSGTDLFLTETGTTNTISLSNGQRLRIVGSNTDDGHGQELWLKMGGA